MARLNPETMLNEAGITKNGDSEIEESKSGTIKVTRSRKGRKPLIEVDDKKPDRKRNKIIEYYTHDGKSLTSKEAKFIDYYIETGNQRQSVIEAGYKSKSPGGYAQDLLRKPHIAGEIAYRLKKLEDEKTASAKEILEYFTRVMRGEEKDQFGLDAPLSERTRAAQELARRTIDIANRVNGKNQSEVKVTLDWGGFGLDIEMED